MATITFFANLSNGNQTQIEFTGNVPKMLLFASNYEGNDIGNDLITESFNDNSFVTDFRETGVIIEK